MSPCHDISPKSTKIGYFTNIFANLNPLFMMDPVFAPFSHFTFTHTFSTQFLGGIIPKNYYHWDEYKISSFGKLKHCFSHNRPVYHLIFGSNHYQLPIIPFISSGKQIIPPYPILSGVFWHHDIPSKHFWVDYTLHGLDNNHRSW